MLHFSEAKLALDAYLLKNFGVFQDSGGSSNQDELWLSEVLLYLEEDQKIKKDSDPDPNGFGAS